MTNRKWNWKTITLTVLGLAVAGGVYSNLTGETYEPAPEPVPVEAEAFDWTSIPECIEEDGSGQDVCVWLGGENGEGDIYLVVDGTFWYPEDITEEPAPAPHDYRLDA